MPTIYRNNITQLSQLGFVAYLKTQTLSFIGGDKIVGGISKVTAARPLIVVQCNRAESAVPFEGNWEADVTIELRSNMDDTTEEQHHARAGELFSVFLGDPRVVSDAISAAYPNFQVQFIVPKDQGFNIDNRSLISHMTFKVDCCGSDLV